MIVFGDGEAEKGGLHYLSSLWAGLDLKSNPLDILKLN